MNGAIALKKAKSYTDESLLGGGAVVGKNVTILSLPRNLHLKLYLVAVQ